MMQARMRQTYLFATVAVALALGLVVAAQVPQAALGTWKMNIAKSTFTGLAPKSSGSRNEAAPGGGMKVTNDSVDAAGVSAHSEVVVMFDGKEYEVKGVAAPTTRAYTRIDDHNYQYVTRVNGKVTTTSRITVAPDGKTRTQVNTGIGADGKPVNTTSFYERQ